MTVIVASGVHWSRGVSLNTSVMFSPPSTNCSAPVVLVGAPSLVKARFGATAATSAVLVVTKALSVVTGNSADQVPEASHWRTPTTGLLPPPV